MAVCEGLLAMDTGGERGLTLERPAQLDEHRRYDGD